MRRRFGQSLRLGLAADGLALLRVGGWPRAGAEVLATAPVEAGAPDALENGLRALLGEANPRGWPLTVVLADDLARLWQVTPPQAASRMADLEAAAALRFQSLFGASAAGWKISADWHAARPFLAAALPLPLLATLSQCAAEQRLPLVEIVPQFVAALNGWRKRRRAGAWFGRVEGSVLTLAAFEQGAPASVRTAVIPPTADASWLDAHVAREALLVGVAPPQLLQLCGAVPRAWASVNSQRSFACTLLEDEGSAPDWSPAARLALTGGVA